VLSNCFVVLAKLWHHDHYNDDGYSKGQDEPLCFQQIIFCQTLPKFNLFANYSI
jgi:hypothetical protein